MPVCNGHHWWVIVDNMRDNRFDIPSSLHFRGEERLVTRNVVSISYRIFFCIINCLYRNKIWCIVFNVF
jgi:hypothetical protein